MPPPAPDEQAIRDTVLASLQNVDQSAFLGAFQKLTNYSYLRYIRTEQFDDQDYVIAYDEFEARIGKGGPDRDMVVERADSAGAFDFGFFNRFVSENVESVDPIDLVPFVLPEDLGYNNPRNVDRYVFRILADTLLWDRQARVFEIRARPQLADGLNIRLVRQFVDRSSNTLLGVYLERIDLGLLFREESAFYLDIKQAPDNDYVPNNTRFESEIKTPFRGAYKIRTVSTFSAFRSLSAP